ncbi:MAG: PhzF family phenazine biosynthesis protein, partial [Planctomycetales bacterium]
MNHAVPLMIVDAFADRPFRGNPAAVCLLEEPEDAAWMQQVASEMNLSETAFVVPQEDLFGLRWFTPTVEVDLCGHATLATAHVVWQEPRFAALTELRFQTRSGILTCTRHAGWIEMDFPAEPSRPVPVPPELAEALGIEPRAVGRNRFDFLVELATEAEVRSVR